MEVVGALAGSECPIGILAGGTGNLLVRALAIPRAVHRAVPTLLHGDVLTIDLGRFDSGRRFAIAAGVGVDAAMVAETPAWLKRRLGVAAYVLVGGWAAIRAVARTEVVAATVTVDGTSERVRATALMVANFGAVLGHRIILGPGIRPDDGLLDVCIFCPRSLGDAARIMWRLIRADFRPHPSMIYRRGRHIQIEAVTPCLVQADGEIVDKTPVCISVEGLAVRVLVPRAR